MRSRNIKPGFFKNEQLAELSVETRLLYIGLWMMADREGRLEDRPKRMKMELFPADSFDCEPLLLGLEGYGLIVRYAVEGVRYIEIPRFKDHQRPHYSEKPSVIPPRDSGKDSLYTGSDSGKDGASRRSDSGKGSASSQGIPGTIPEDSGNTAPGRGGDSALNPDSLNPESRTLNPDSSPEREPGVGKGNGLSKPLGEAISKKIAPAPPQDDRPFDVIKQNVTTIAERFRTKDPDEIYRLGGKAYKLSRKQCRTACQQLREDGVFDGLDL